jgi:tetratricopeptide (TPR) repeat protein
VPRVKLDNPLKKCGNNNLLVDPSQFKSTANGKPTPNSGILLVVHLQPVSSNNSPINCRRASPVHALSIIEALYSSAQTNFARRSLANSRPCLRPITVYHKQKMMSQRFHRQAVLPAVVAILVLLITRIQGRSTQSPMIHSKVRNYNHINKKNNRQRRYVLLSTKGAINAALLETRGGAWGFRSRSRKDTNETDNTTTTNNNNATTTKEQAAQLRTLGKASHDANQFQEAAAQFQQAANLLETMFAVTLKEKDQQSNNEGGEEEEEEDPMGHMISSELRDEWATCRLHESLCHLKAEQYDECVAACDSLVNEDSCAPMFRARAYHRRAKAKLALEDTDGALMDARSAAFLGDRKAVTFYGKLLRETGGHSDHSYPLENSMFPSSSSSMNTAGDSLLASLLSKSSPMEGGEDGNDFLTSALMGAMGGGAPGAGSGSLAQSVLKKLSKKLDDESTHDGICQYLQSTNALQLQSVATLAGIDLSHDHANRLVGFAHGVTPKRIRSTVKITKRAVWCIQLIRKIMALLSKYRHIFFLLLLLQWTKSAVFRPVPMLNKVKAPKQGKPANKAGPQLPPKPDATSSSNGNGNTGAGTQKNKGLTPGLLGGLR